MKYDEFMAISWPERFTVHCQDGSSETLLREGGLSFESPGDDPLGRGGISATMLPARSGQRGRHRRHYYFDEIGRIADEDGSTLWETA